MDRFVFSEVPTWAYLIIILLTLLYKYATWNYDYWKKRGIPGNKPHLFIGTFKPPWIYPVDKEDVKNLKRFGKTHGGFDGNKPILFTSDPEIIRQVTVKDFSVFPNRRHFRSVEKQRYVKEVLSLLRDEEWKSVRTAMTPTFTTGKLKQMVGFIEECVDELIAQMEIKVDNGEALEMTRYFTVLTLNVIARCAFGMNIDCIKNPESEFVTTARKVMQGSPKMSYLALIFPKIFQLLPLSPNPFKYFVTVANQAIDLRMQNKSAGNGGKKNFLDILFDAQISDQPEDCPTDESNKDPKLATKKKILTRDSVIGQTILFLLAGHETTASTLGFMAMHLAMNPQVQDKLIAEIDDVMNECKGEMTYEIVGKMQYLDMVVSETLRLEPPAQRIERECTQNEYPINGTKIDKGCIVSIPIYALHQDPEIYPNPEVFDPERFSPENKANRHPFAYIPFGAGPRNCIAARFALMEAKVVMVYILSKFRFNTWEKTEFPLKYTPGNGLRRPASVNLMLQKRVDQPHFGN